MESWKIYLLSYYGDMLKADDDRRRAEIVDRTQAPIKPDSPELQLKRKGKKGKDIDEGTPVPPL